VSPVALVATYEDQHVLSATTYSKSALRVVAETAARTFSAVSYFPSYEMITGPHTRSQFFADDMREVRPEGVAYVMSVFEKHYLRSSRSEYRPTSALPLEPEQTLQSAAESIKEIEGVICDEEQIIAKL
jgi:hypothetical protein